MRLSPYDSRMTANAAELVLANVFDTIGGSGSESRPRASDTRAVLFLARRAREFGADANLFHIRRRSWLFSTDVLRRSTA
jgi:hypothetical protein